MSKFPKGKDEYSCREILAPAMEITDQKEADEYLEDFVNYIMRSNKTKEEALVIVKSNLGYYAGYYDYETMNRVNKLFCTSHPIFGSKNVTTEEAYESGKEHADKLK